MEAREAKILEFYDDLAAGALGRLYWSEEQVLYSDVNAMLIGLNEHAKLLRSIFGEASSPGRPGRGVVGSQPVKITPQLFDIMFAPAGAGRRKH